MRTIEEYEIINHGVDYSCYFQGCGVYFSDFEDVATGIGDSEKDALDDALDLLAQRDWDVEGNEDLMADLHDKADATDVIADVIKDYAEEIGVDDDGCPPDDWEQPWVHVSVRVR